MAGDESVVSRSGKLFIMFWSLVIISVFVALGMHTVSAVRHFRESSAKQHDARFDPHAVEAGRTAAEDKLPAGATPRQVAVGIYIDGIAAISILESAWSPVFYIWFRWTGDDINPGETFRIMEGAIDSKEKVSESVVNGEHHALYLVRATITKFFTADRFPVDDHLLTIGIEDSLLPWDKLAYVADEKNSGISSRVKMPGYIVSRTGMVVKPHTYKTNFGDPSRQAGTHVTQSQLLYGVWNQRAGFGPYLRVFVGLFAAAFIALLAFFIKPTDVDPRFGLGVGGFFGAVANTLLAGSMVPDSGATTLMDMVNAVGMITIFMSIVQSTICLYIFDIRENRPLAQLFDRVSVVLFATGFAVINVLLPLAGMAHSVAK